MSREGRELEASFFFSTAKGIVATADMQGLLMLKSISDHG
jgi:hypothetical protein